MGISISILVHEALKEGQENDLNIEPKRPVLDVEEIALNSLVQIGGSAPAIDLGPSRDASFHHVLFHVSRDFVLEFVDEDRAFRSRAYDGHVSQQNINELGKFIEACLSKECAGSGGATLACFRPHST